MEGATRQHGLAPSCIKCDGAGRFQDWRTRTTRPLRDARFEAVHTFRFLGYLLQEAGYPCPALFDRDDPFKKVYGYYDPEICKPLPAPGSRAP